MRVALIADVHANLPALEAVLADARTEAAEVLWNLGDFLGYGPFPDEVVRLLRAEEAVSVIGNYDAKVLAFPRRDQRWRLTKRAEKHLAFRWAYENTSDESRRYLRSLPEQRLLTVERFSVLLTHGSPAGDDDALGPDTPKERLAELAGMTEAEVILCGHSHQPFSGQAGGTRFINPGSVGRPEGGDPRACWALLELRAGRLSAHPRKVEYDVERAAEAIRAAGLPESFAQMLRLGRNLKQIQ